MQGIELAREYYRACLAPLLAGELSDIAPFLAVGLFGAGSECLGYDDGISRDHDFGPALCLLLPDEATVDRRAAFRLERAYARLPQELCGYRRPALSPVGGARHGVLRTADFFLSHTGTPDGVLSPDGWLALPEQALLEATNGEVFTDPYGEVTAIRRRLAYLPEDVRLLRLAGHILLLGQAGQYNYPRALLRGDTAAAQMAAVAFAESALSAVFLLNFAYRPYYKWAFRSLRALPRLAGLAEPLEYLISSGNGEGERDRKTAVIGKVTAEILATLREDGLTDYAGDTAEGHAYAVRGRIGDPDLRNRHILSGV